MAQKYTSYPGLSSTWNRSWERSSANGCMNQSIHSWSAGFCRQRYNGPEISLWDLVGFIGFIREIFFSSWRNIFSQVRKKAELCKTCKLASCYDLWAMQLLIFNTIKKLLMQITSCSQLIIGRYEFSFWCGRLERERKREIKQ